MTAGTLTLAEFLLARIADDEAASESALRKVSATPEEAATWRWVIRGRADREAKRRIVEDSQNSGVIDYHAVGLRIAMRHLASAYADHPDYRDEWCA